MHRNNFGLSYGLSICHIDVWGEKRKHDVNSKKDINGTFKNLQARASIIEILDSNERNLERQRNRIIDGKHNYEDIPVELDVIVESYYVPALANRLSQGNLILLLL